MVEHEHGLVARVLALVSLASPLSGCLVAPAMPAGPLQGTAIQGGGAFGASLAPGTLVTSETDPNTGQETTTTNKRPEVVFGAPIPQRLSLRLGLMDWVDVGGDVSWYDSGVELRAGIPEWASSVPFAFSVAHRRGMPLFEPGPENEAHLEWRARAELYPRLASRARLRRWHGVLALGGSVGDRIQRVGRPSQEDSGAGRRDVFLIRNETRIEGAFGVELRMHAAVLRFAALPYWVVAHDEPWSSEEQIESFERSFGVAAMVHVGFSFALSPGEEAKRFTAAGID